jgi:AcrR family transcriptional regulator
MSSPQRLQAAERRDSIVEASLHLFAQHGFHGVTTKEVAKAAGISEALLYKHFASKEDLFEEIRRSCLDESKQVGTRVAALEPSTSTLVIAIYVLVTSIFEVTSPSPRKQSIRRILIASLAEDGAFVRAFLKTNVERWVPIMVECVEAARKAGELVDDGSTARARIWLTHHLAAAMSWFHLQEKPLVNYGESGEALADEVVLFARARPHDRSHRTPLQPGGAASARQNV